MFCHSVTYAPALAFRPVVALPPLGPASSLSGVFGKSKREGRLRQLVDNYVGLVARILRNAGTAEADIEDDAQRVFITMSNRLDDVHVGAEKSFLVQTALNMAAHSRRAAARRREILTDHPPEVVDSFAGPEEMAHRQQVRRTLDRILDEMDTDIRVVLVLYEFEELTTAEIAAVLEIPQGTVASRLRRARADFRERVSVIEGLSKAEVG
jgi:RNA polymerase sigma-70 factor (ECF subfamily)